MGRRKKRVWFVFVVVWILNNFPIKKKKKKKIRKKNISITT